VFKKLMPSMKVNNTVVSTLRKAMLAAATVFVLTQCSEEEVTPAVQSAEPETAVAASSNLSMASMTVAGVNTTFATAKDCKTCTFVVPEGTELVDGKELGLQPGNVICINAAFKYGNLEFVNIEGTEENPIVIATVGAAENATPDQGASEANPY
jgi:hypothetical protein